MLAPCDVISCSRNGIWLLLRVVRPQTAVAARLAVYVHPNRFAPEVFDAALVAKPTAAATRDERAPVWVLFDHRPAVRAWAPALAPRRVAKRNLRGRQALRFRQRLERGARQICMPWADTTRAKRPVAAQTLGRLPDGRASVWKRQRLSTAGVRAVYQLSGSNVRRQVVENAKRRGTACQRGCNAVEGVLGCAAARYARYHRAPAVDNAVLRIAGEAGRAHLVATPARSNRRRDAAALGIVQTDRALKNTRRAALRLHPTPRRRRPTPPADRDRDDSERKIRNVHTPSAVLRCNTLIFIFFCEFRKLFCQICIRCTRLVTSALCQCCRHAVAYCCLGRLRVGVTGPQ